MTLQEAQNRVDQWIQQFGVRYFGELTNLALLMEETGELARIMARTYGEQSAKAGEDKKSLADEMADVLADNLKKNTTRDHSRHLNNPKL
jgi:NTP pyrophosphatase (non-canonical NTP hydrolase)